MRGQGETAARACKFRSPLAAPGCPAASSVRSDNSGTILGQYGIYTTSNAGTLSNTGTITGNGHFAVQNAGSIDSFDNGGTVDSSGSTAIYNDLGIINTLTNSGVVSAFIGPAIISSGSIGTLNNTSIGTISGLSGISNSGISNSGVVDALTNSGQINGADRGIYNHSGTGAALISTLINNTNGSISRITNATSGTIGGGGPVALTNNGTITQINNGNGTILGPTGIMNTGSIGGLANSGSGFISSVENTGFFGDGGQVFPTAPRSSPSTMRQTARSSATQRESPIPSRSAR